MREVLSRKRQPASAPKGGWEEKKKHRTSVPRSLLLVKEICDQLEFLGVSETPMKYQVESQ